PGAPDHLRRTTGPGPVQVGGLFGPARGWRKMRQRHTGSASGAGLAGRLPNQSWPKWWGPDRRPAGLSRLETHAPHGCTHTPELVITPSVHFCILLHSSNVNAENMHFFALPRKRPHELANSN